MIKMIDLNQHKPAKKQEEQEAPLGIVILTCLPFAWGFAWILFQGLLH